MIRLTQVYKTFDGGRSNAVKHLSFSVDILEKRNLVKRTRLSNVQRKIHFEVTDAGVEFIQNAPALLQLRFFDRLKELDKQKVSMILWSLEMLVDMLGDGIGPWICPRTYRFLNSEVMPCSQ